MTIVRHRNEEEPYLTRFGKKGARGIDHIFIPCESENDEWIQEAFIDIETGLSYFPSDHLLLAAILQRTGGLSTHNEQDIVKFKYKEIYSIKLKQDKSTREIVGFDDSQFFTEKVKQQQKLYENLTKTAENNTSGVKYQINEINEECDGFIKDLFNKGTKQNTNGEKNILVKIDKTDADRLSKIFEAFETGVQNTMTQLRLKITENRQKKSLSGRKFISQGKSLQPFASLPLPTKLRYLNVRVVRTVNKLKGLHHIITLFIERDYTKLNDHIKDYL